MPEGILRLCRLIHFYFFYLRKRYAITMVEALSFCNCLFFFLEGTVISKQLGLTQYAADCLGMHQYACTVAQKFESVPNSRHLPRQLKFIGSCIG